jgi:hypothetical protein
MKLKANQPQHGLGPHGKPHRMAGLMAGEHMPQKLATSGISSGKERRNGKQTGHLNADGTSDTRVRKGSEGNAKGSPPPGVKKSLPASLEAHKGDAGRGGSGRHGKGDIFKGKATALSESPSSAWFEKLGAS